MPISSSPATFTCGPTTNLTQTLTFAIPAGTYLTGTAAISATAVSGSGSGGTFNTSSAGINFTGPGAAGLPQAFSDSKSIPSGMLSDINGAAGGNLSASFVYPLGSQINVTSLTLTLTAAGADNPPFGERQVVLKVQIPLLSPPPPPNPFEGGRQPLAHRRLPASVIAVPVTPVNTSTSSAPVVMSLRQEQPGTVSYQQNASSTPVRMRFQGGGGTVLNVPNLWTSSRPVKMAFAGDAGTATASQTGNLKWSMCRDNRGATWTSEVSVDSGVDQNSSGAAWLGNRWGILYSKTNALYWKTAANPDDWSGAAVSVAGATGIVYGLARNRAGVLCAMVNKTPLVSRDGGATWHASASIGSATLPCSIVAKSDLFVVACPSGNAVTHFVSKDGGLTFV